MVLQHTFIFLVTLNICVSRNMTNRNSLKNMSVSFKAMCLKTRWEDAHIWAEIAFERLFFFKTQKQNWSENSLLQFKQMTSYARLKCLWEFIARFQQKEKALLTQPRQLTEIWRQRNMDRSCSNASAQHVCYTRRRVGCAWRLCQG